MLLNVTQSAKIAFHPIGITGSFARRKSGKF